MFPRTASPQLRSLAEIRPGQRVRVEPILFEMLKDLCRGIGIVEGDVVRCRRTSRAVVLLEVASGRTVILESDWARFVEVSLAGELQSEPAGVRLEASP